jgi:chromosome segregation ATPase
MIRIDIQVDLDAVAADGIEAVDQSQAADQAKAWRLCQRLYTAAEVGDAQAGEAELIAAPLRTRINALENRIVNLTEYRRVAEQRTDELEKSLQLARASREFNRKRAVELEDEVDRLQEKLTKVSRVASEVSQTESWTELFEAVRKIQDLTNPWSPPAEQTSQA